MKQSIKTKLEMTRERFEELAGLLADPEVIGDKNRFRDLSKEYARLEPVVRLFQQFETLTGDIAAAEEMAGDSDRDVRGVFGLSWLLPLNVRTSIWVGTDKSFRWSAGKEIAVTSRLMGFADTQYDTVTGWEWTSGGELILTRHLSLYGQYSSEFGAGGGVRLRLFSPSF